jgi:arsenate reductase
VFPGAVDRSHWSFQDPSKATGTEQDQLEVYRRVRNEIAARIRMFAAATEPRGAAVS